MTSGYHAGFTRRIPRRICATEPYETPNLFKSNESGAVTVDWVVLTAAIVGLGMIVVSSVGSGITTLATKVSIEVSDRGSVYIAP